MFCADCRHYRPHAHTRMFDKCDAPDIERDPVTGEARWKYCNIQRESQCHPKACGPEGRFFEPAMRVGTPADLGCEVLP